MGRLFLLAGARRRDSDVAAWFEAEHGGLRELARPWFERMRGCGADVAELLHDGHPTACVEGAAFGYVDAFRGHANVGFFHGAALADPSGLLEGAGKRMRHVKLRYGHPIAETALEALVEAAYRDIRARLGSTI